MATFQKKVPNGRLKGKARREAGLHEMPPATASSAYTKPTETEEEARTSSDDKGLVHLDVATTSAATMIAEKLKEAVDAESVDA
ncbi:hypothetical protein HO133_001444 [Letharia lupina]|uniref:Uncharacterized protein n=1 Tax=Letharia lupina TaxID=560253 RepID=A0A8H6CF06_9LECA|nr:uncharacterized protein HO133_001444 [Letharia lupina]KAF6222358.1 hypothetical protein HO133_001444 [Letharia lupina]